LQGTAQWRAPIKALPIKALIEGLLTAGGELADAVDNPYVDRAIADAEIIGHRLEAPPDTGPCRVLTIAEIGVPVREVLLLLGNGSTREVLQIRLASRAVVDVDIAAPDLNLRIIADVVDIAAVVDVIGHRPEGPIRVRIDRVVLLKPVSILGGLGCQIARTPMTRGGRIHEVAITGLRRINGGVGGIDVVVRRARVIDPRLIVDARIVEQRVVGCGPNAEIPLIGVVKGRRRVVQLVLAKRACPPRKGAPLTGVLRRIDDVVAYRPGFDVHRARVVDHQQQVRWHTAPRDQGVLRYVDGPSRRRPDQGATHDKPN